MILAQSIRHPYRRLPRFPTRLYSSLSHYGTGERETTGSEEDPVATLERIQQHPHRHQLWDDRIALQALWTLKEKGWRVSVEWKETAHGIGVFATESIDAGRVLRVGRPGRNLFPLTSVDDIDAFCGREDSNEYKGRLAYVKDYLWGFSTENTDHRGYPRPPNGSTPPDERDKTRFFGMWLPGNGLNHHPSPNTVYRVLGEMDKGIALVALTDIAPGDELVDDYRRHGTAPAWLSDFSQRHNVTLNFADCNTFVGDHRV